MSNSIIANATAALSAITPVNDNIGGTTQGNQSSSSSEDSSGSRPQGSFGKYNKQMLISNYLNRGKETGNQTKQPTGNIADKGKEIGQIYKILLSDPEKSNQGGAVDTLIVEKGYRQGPTSTDTSAKRLEAEFRNMFGTSEKLPQIQKKHHLVDKEGKSNDPTRPNEKSGDTTQGPTGIDRVIDLTDKEDSPVSLFNKTHSVTKSFKLPESTFSENGLSFDFSITPDANAQSLPLFFQKNMQTLQGQLPLTIFNKAWQQTASNNHVEYKKGEKEIEKYRGYPFPGEWTQSRFEWGDNMDNFISMLREDYKFTGFADAMEIHKKNVHNIFRQQRSWVIAFKYDLTIRKAVFAVRNPDQKVPNPALEPVGLVNEIFYTARAQEDLNTDDNPYRKGGPKAGKYPYSDVLTDAPAPSTLAKTNVGPSRNYIEKKDKQQFRTSGPYGNYKGRNFNPNHNRNDNSKDNVKGKGKEKDT
ncbi:uncharacterized protein MELLADRAFT_86908 [Melampsora larici-populina 98AG31]|uniref:Uncharacterized protein n=1 Tax=Melampsora larici-populina (strain 98AG31 / pathotype 3-4-7) TaxID=747676 RepID=F4R3U0_MELLP|nr:uncharacterized protein MELLADRAFT_86908 [Melampsora larici-populina 98AG31]EGG13108.1 hypothetical protein MELLADRAFT_86908 [Melampsora larici-populina 98AG31]